MFVPLVLVGLMAAPYCSEGSIVLQPSDPLSHADKVLLLTQRLQQALFANNSSQTIPSMREVFFPSSKYRYWQADNIGIIDIKVCINFQAEDSQEEKETSLNSVHIRSQCLRFRWTNSYFLNLVDIRQMTYFEFLTAGALFGIIAHGRKDRQIRLTFDMTPNESISSIEDTTTKQALIQFLSWSKLYARSQDLPRRWDETDQGYVTRKYDYTAVDLFLFDKRNQQVFIITLVCFILCNTMTTYILLKKAPLIHAKLCKAASQNGYTSSVAKGALVLAAVLVIAYLLAAVCAYSTEQALKFTDQCEGHYGCIPKDEFPTVHRTQVLSLTSSFTSLLIAMVLYSIGSIHTVKTSTVSVFNSCYKCCEAFLLWSALTGIHIAAGLASIPLLIFSILTPMYMIFYLSSVTIGLALFLLPIAAAFHITEQAREHTQDTAHTVQCIIRFAFSYLVGTGIVITALFLYFLFLTGGASMSGVKGALYSLLPPLMISIVVFVLKRKMAKRPSSDMQTMEEKQPLLSDTVTEQLP